ncbi:hypothetical protein FH972_025912 [Carpinus fangiana]|uniref:Uncharacterized protein n=1 Tax=Carpinus fangiana TaxID=176857 RepID=A0A5N6L2M8_9ROSI|nr:hypothetical protein FH972_025912 [Carpinus fangiana]
MANQQKSRVALCNSPSDTVVGNNVSSIGLDDEADLSSVLDSIMLFSSPGRTQ